MDGIPLGELELAIMEYVWKRSRDATVRNVHQHLQARRTIAYTTVMTVMSRLHDKGLLTRREEGRAYAYRPSVSRDEYFAQLMVGVLAAIDDRRGVLARFVERIRPSDAALLRELAAKARRKR